MEAAQLRKRKPGHLGCSMSTQYRSHADPCMSTREGCRCQGSEGTYPGAPHGSWVQKSCDKMRLGDLRFPHGNRAHESQDSDRTKATTGRPDSAAAALGHIAKAREDLFPRRWSRSLRRVASNVVRRLAGARSEARRGSAMQIAENRGDMRCESDQSSAPDLAPGACRTPQQEHRRRSRHQPAHGRQPLRGNHEKTALGPSRP
jgi:hypothetical protein